MIAPRIASLLASATEILYGLGLGERVVAVSHECDWPAEVIRKPRVTRTRIDAQAASGKIDVEVRQLLASGGPLYEIDAERLAALAPDLIVTQAQCDACAVRYQDVLDLVARTPALAATRVVALNPMSLADVLLDIRRVGEAAGCPERAELYVAELEDRIAAVHARTAGLPARQRPRVAAIEWIEPLMLGGNWMPELIDMAGGTSTLTTPGRHSPYINWETVRAWDPQVVVIMPCGFDLARTIQEAAPLRGLAGWGDVSAVRAVRVFAVDGNAFFNRSGPRLVESLEILAHLVQPSLFGPPVGLKGAWRRWE